ncbi:SDR family NAD(P)-dependent oxidoreductase [Caldinitratiruptor microaerophilus]|uniref:Short chain dehydrogenase n=1 Tax=Caldinitratiruptor microaerophilus TaxID=671077 RepID=A0AA35CP46_9FIRM|nr:SDR family NAD(P)-dependent oxidoreductase [Caldinitratiruptor microaerophilus]BDG62168.1 short chain dehydrogenase [Caldinitratiruptor microaerophilus]
MRLAGKRALVTGAGSGIGRAIAVAFAAEGARVGIVDVDPAGGEETLAEVRRLSGGFFFAADVSKAADAEAMVAAAVRELGGLDVLVNNAGVGVAATLHETSLEDWQRVIDIDLTGVFLGCKYAIPVFLNQGHGNIINIASVAGLVGVANRAAYNAAKAGVVGLTKSIAADYSARGIRANAICPGTVDSPWIQKILASDPDAAATRRKMEQRQLLGRMGRPEEIARLAVYLASDESEFMTGSAVVIDGGMTAV